MILMALKEIVKKWKAKISPEEESKIRNKLEQERKKMSLFSDARRLFESQGITIEQETTETYTVKTDPYKVLKDGVIYTVIQIEEVFHDEPDTYRLFLPDNTQILRTSDEIIRIYEAASALVMKYLLDQKKDPQQ